MRCCGSALSRVSYVAVRHDNGDACSEGRGTCDAWRGAIAMVIVVVAAHVELGAAVTM